MTLTQQPNNAAPKLLAPVHRTMIVVDIERSTTRKDATKARVRQALYELLDKAMETSGVNARHHDPLVDRGDGVLIAFLPCDDVPKTLLLSTFVPTLNHLLADHNARRPSDAFRLRVALHAGEVQYDPRGLFGEAVDITCRLLDASEVKNALGSSSGPLVLVVSDYIESIVRHGYDGIDPRTFSAIMRVEVAGRTYHGWIHVPAILPESRDHSPNTDG